MHLPDVQAVPLLDGQLPPQNAAGAVASPVAGVDPLISEDPDSYLAIGHKGDSD